MFTRRATAGTFVLAAALLAPPASRAGAEGTASVDLVSTPAPGQASGPVDFTATGHSPIKAGFRGQLHYYFDGLDSTLQNCTEDPCISKQFWNPTSLSGTHTVQAVYNTDGQTVTSQVLSFHVFTGTHIAGIQIVPNSADPKKTVTAFVYDDYWNRGAAGAPISITLTPTVGKATTRSAAALADGSAKLSYTVRYNTKITVQGGGNDRWGASTGSKTIKFTPTWSCTLAHTTIRHGHPDTITCKVPGLPSRTKIALQYLSGTKWVTLAKGHSTAGKLTLTFIPKSKGTLQLRAQTSGARVYQDSSSRTVQVKVT